MLTGRTVAILERPLQLSTDPLPSRSLEAASVLPCPWLLAGLTSGVLLWLCYFPVGWTWLAWIALVPLLCLVRARLPTASTAKSAANSSLAGRLLRWLTRPSRQLFYCAWLAGLTFFVPALQWMRVADPTMYVAWLAVALYCSLFMPVAVLTVRWLERSGGVPLLLSAPCLWTALEFFRAHFGTGFAWYFLAHTQHNWLPLIQISDLTGAYGVTLLIVLANVVIFELLAAQTWFCRWFGLAPTPIARRTRVVAGVAFFAILAGDLGYGAWRLSQNVAVPGPRLAMLQGNLGQDVKNHGTKKEILDHYLDLLRTAVQQHPKPDLIVWPETGFPYWWEEIVFDTGTEQSEREKTLSANELSKLNERILEIAHASGVPMLVGVNAGILDEKTRTDRAYNSAVLLIPQRRALVNGYAIRSADFVASQADLRLLSYQPDADLYPGTAMPVRAGDAVPQGADAVVALRDAPTPAPNGLAHFVDWVPSQLRGKTTTFPGQNLVGCQGRYDKIHRVPLGEFVPFKSWLPWLQKFTPYDEEYGVLAGEEFTHFTFQDGTQTNYCFGVLICYEDSDPYLARQYVSSDREPVDFLLNISNDAWFKGTEEHDEHLAICRFRAIECRRAFARSVNMGISAVIDGDGRVLPAEVVSRERQAAAWEERPQDGRQSLAPAHWGEFKKVSGVLTARIPIDSRASLYARWGDWFAWSCWGVIGLAVAWSGLRRRPFGPQV